MRALLWGANIELLHENPDQRVQGPGEKTAKNHGVKEYLAIHMHEGNLWKVETSLPGMYELSPENVLLKAVVQQPPVGHRLQGGSRRSWGGNSPLAVTQTPIRAHSWGHKLFIRSISVLKHLPSKRRNSDYQLQWQSRASN